ncbi:cytochrome c oxidase assembly protein [Pararobbsia alpina]|nr:cytochrome c oxidase assembly protein [Pararobbsia alpina]
MAVAQLVLLLAAAPSASAHVRSADERGAPPLAWSFDAWVVLPLAISAVLYTLGYIRLRARSRHAKSAHARQLAAFAGGWLMLVVSLDSPLDSLSAALFSAHMVQHELMMIVAAPLFVLGRPLSVWVWAFPHGARTWLGRAVRTRGVRACWRAITTPAGAWLLHAAALWAWHEPKLFEAALANPRMHTLQHASFLFSALLFWWTIFGEPARRRGSGPAMLSLFTTMVHTGALGALITLSPGLWYPSYVEPCSALGFDPLHDQELGGLVMWVPGGLAYLVAGLAVSARWLFQRQAHVFIGRPFTAPPDGGV